MTRPRFLRLCLAAALALLALPARAQEVRAAAIFNPARIELGETTELQLQVAGAGRVAKLPEIKVDGLDIQYIGQSTSYRMGIENGHFARTVITLHTYQVTPRRAGTFTVPALSLDADGTTVHTEPVALTVQNGGANGEPAAGGLDSQGHASIVLGKTTAYIGEVVPAELRLMIDTRINWEFDAPPDFEGEGFTKSKMPKAKSEQAHRDGRDYDVGVFAITVTPIRAGKVPIGPAEFHYRAQVPRAQRARPRSQFGDDFFENFFNDPRNGLGVVREYKATAEPAVLEVKPLPTAGQPKSFSGAVGRFQLASEGSPARVKVGDPITMKLTVSGTGNFDRVTAPVLNEPDGWRTYPPSESARAEDETGMRSTKTFEVAVIPEIKQTHLPVFEFAYFDPDSAKYVVLKSKPEPLVVEGDAVPPRPMAAVPSNSAPSAPDRAPAPPAPTDILGLRYDYGAARSLHPLLRQPGFLLAQGVPAVALLGFMFLRLRRPNRRAQQLARWRRERAELAARLRREPDRAAFFGLAGRVLQYDAAIRTGHEPEAMDVPAIHRALQADEETTRAIDEIAEARGAVLFAGGAGEAALSEPERARVLAVLGKTSRA